MFVVDHAEKRDLRSFLAALPAEDEANEIIVPARLDPLSIQHDRGPDAARERSRSLTALLGASLPGARRSRPSRTGR